MTGIELAIIAPLAWGQVLNTIKAIKEMLAAGNTARKQIEGNTSLINITKTARVEPLTIIGQDCLNLEYLPDVLQSLQSIFSGYYLQALAITTNIGSVKVGKVLAKLNPDANTMDFMSFESFKDNMCYSGVQFHPAWRMCAESYTYRLPTRKNSLALAAEAQTLSAPVEKTQKDGTSVRDKNVVDHISDMTNLSVGKMINVTIREGGNQVELPISIRLIATQIAEKSLVELLTLQNKSTTFMERFHAYRSGRIEFIKDLVLCQDMIDAQKKAMINDKDGVVSAIVGRSNASKANPLFGVKDVHLASASNLYVISEATQATIESKLGSKLSNFKTREELFKSGYMMILVVIDRTWERVTFYHRGIVSPTNVGIRDIKVSNKGSGPDIGDILKAYQLGNSPSL